MQTLKQVELKDGIINWLNEVKTSGVESVKPSDVFKQYKPLDRGNTKLNSNILSFNLLPVVTCENLCEGCYDIRAMRYKSVRAKRYVNTSMAMHNESELESLIVKQILNSKTVEFIRIHVGGDFYSKKYVRMWGRIKKEIEAKKPEIVFYTYTKTQHTNQLKMYGINVVKSQYDAQYNFGSLEYIKAMKDKHGGVICPATLGKVENQFCGSKCKACMKMENVFFKLH